MHNIPSCDELDASYEALRTLVTNPEFQRVLEEIHSFSPIEGVQATFTRLTPEALAARGIPVPDNCTITVQASQDSTVMTTSTADVTATEQDMTTKSVLQSQTRVCVGICPACVCWNFRPVTRSSGCSD